MENITIKPNVLSLNLDKQEPSVKQSVVVLEIQIITGITVRFP